MEPLKTRTARAALGGRVEAHKVVGPTQWVVCLGGPPLWEEAPPKSSGARRGEVRGRVGCKGRGSGNGGVDPQGTNTSSSCVSESFSLCLCFFSGSGASVGKGPAVQIVGGARGTGRMGGSRLRSSSLGA
mgnify:CR=1 FL=1